MCESEIHASKVFLTDLPTEDCQKMKGRKDTKLKQLRRATIAETITSARSHLFFPGHGETAWAGLRYHLAPKSDDPNSNFRIIMGLQSKAEFNGRVAVVTGEESNGRIPVGLIDAECIQRFLLKVSPDVLAPTEPSILIRPENLVWFDLAGFRWCG